MRPPFTEPRIDSPGLVLEPTFRPLKEHTTARLLPVCQNTRRKIHDLRVSRWKGLHT